MVELSENAINWGVSCEACARLLDSCYSETVRADEAEAEVARLKATIRKIMKEVQLVSLDYTAEAGVDGAEAGND